MPTQNALNLRKYREEATKAGVCIHCFTVKPHRTKAECSDCRKEKQVNRKKRDARYKELGLCTCGSKKLKKFKHCYNCRKKKAERNRRYRLKIKVARQIRTSVKSANLN